MQTDHITVTQHLLKRCFFHLLTTKLVLIFIMCKNSYIKTTKFFCKGTASMPKAYDANCFSIQFHTTVFITQPLVLFYFFKTVADLIHEVQQHGKRVFTH